MYILCKKATKVRNIANAIGITCVDYFQFPEQFLWACLPYFLVYVDKDILM